MASIDSIAEELGKLTVLEVAELVKKLETDWGVSAAAPVAAMAAAPAGGGEAAPAAEEKTEFTVFMDAFGDNKINVIKEVRGAVPGLGLAEAKKLVESAPTVVVENLPKDQAEEVKKKLEAAGAKISLK